VAIRPHGVSDHFPWPGKMRDDDDVLRYLDDAARLGLRVGLEYDLGVAPPLRASTRASLHYVIGALHQLSVDGVRIPFDEAGAFLKGRLASFSERDRFGDGDLARGIRARMLEVVRESFERDGIDILGHGTMSPLAALGDPERVYPAQWQEQLIQLCLDADVAIEVNEAYGVPHREFLERARRMGARFAVGSDTHGPLAPLERTAAMIEAASLPHDRFLSGARVRVSSGARLTAGEGGSRGA
jgi:histidinol phosphatase-like PHP family hydrolase